MIFTIKLHFKFGCCTSNHLAIYREETSKQFIIMNLDVLIYIYEYNYFGSRFNSIVHTKPLFERGETKKPIKS